jgi:hypothetical protein
MARKSFPSKRNALDVGAASPVGDRAEFKAAFDAIRAAYPGAALTYVGTDGADHYFQKHGDATAYVVPVSKGWKA